MICVGLVLCVALLSVRNTVADAHRRGCLASARVATAADGPYVKAHVCADVGSFNGAPRAESSFLGVRPFRGCLLFGGAPLEGSLFLKCEPVVTLVILGLSFSAHAQKRVLAWLWMHDRGALSKRLGAGIVVHVQTKWRETIRRTAGPRLDLMIFEGGTVALSMRSDVAVLPKMSVFEEVGL